MIITFIADGYLILDNDVCYSDKIETFTGTGSGECWLILIYIVYAKRRINSARANTNTVANEGDVGK